MSTRKRRSSSNVNEAQVPDEEKPVVVPVAAMPVAEEKAAPAAKVMVPEAEVKAGSDYFRAQFDGIDSKLKAMDEKIKPVDLKGLEGTVMALNVASGEMFKRLVDLERELRVFNTIFKAVLGVGAVGVLLVVAVILRLTGHL